MTPRPGHPTPRAPAAVLAALVAVLALVVAACGGEEPRKPRVQPPADQRALDRLGPAEGAVRLAALSGVVQDGSAGGADWVSGFEARSGCTVDLTTARSADELAKLVAEGRVDAAAVPGESTLRLVADGAVAPINTRLLRHHADLFEGLRTLDATTVGRRTYGVPQGRAANVLMWRKDRMPGSLRSTGSYFDPAQAAPYRGWIALRDDPSTIADAALWLARERPELEIEDPYALDDRQFRAAVEVLERLREDAGAYWTDADQAQELFGSGDAIVGASLQVVEQRLRERAEPVPVEAIVPREGATGSVDAWMVAAAARNPSCAYRWIDHVLSPQANARIAEALGIAPAVAGACERPRDEERCDAFDADDEGFWEEVRLATTPTVDCGDERGRVCTDRAAWVAAWERLRRPAS